jgi:hypothetical protein
MALSSRGFFTGGLPRPRRSGGGGESDLPASWSSEMLSDRSMIGQRPYPNPPPGRTTSSYALTVGVLSLVSMLWTAETNNNMKL